MFTALTKTLAGKIAIGVVVATTSVGAVAAAGVDLPLVASPSQHDAMAAGASRDDHGSAGDDGQDADETTTTTSTEPDDDSDVVVGSAAIDDGSTVSDVESPDDADESADDESADDESADDESADDESADDESADDVDAADADDVAQGEHGSIVSEFTQSAAELGLQGCEKGQATAAVARRDVDPETSDDLLADLAPYLAKCGTETGADESAVPADDAIADEGADAGSETWKTIRDEGKADVLDAQAAFDDRCGDDDADPSSDGAPSGDVAADDELSSECESLKQAAMDARQEWKDTWMTARDEAKQQRAADRAAVAAERSTGKPAEAGRSADAGKPAGAGAATSGSNESRGKSGKHG